MTIGSGPDRLHAAVEVEPAQLGAAAIAIRAAADRIDKLAADALWHLHVQPAMADPVSVEFAAFVTQHHVTSSSSIVHVMERYRDVLLGIADALEASRLAYERAEVDAAERFT